MAILSAAQFPADTLPVASTNALAALNQHAPWDYDPAVMNEARLAMLSQDRRGTAAYGGSPGSHRVVAPQGLRTGATPGLRWRRGYSAE